MAHLSIVLDNVRKVYGSGSAATVALDGVSLEVRSGEFVSIMGPSGSGKSTLLNLMGALDRPTSGRVLIAERDVSKMVDDELSRVRNRYIGFVFQQFNLINRLTVLENVEVPLIARGLPPAKRREMAMNALRMFGVDRYWNRSPRFLSGGEQQRVAIARALAGDPEFILADEPTGNLDSKNSEVVMNALLDVNRRAGKGVVLVTHNEELAAMADRLIRIRDGKIVGVEVLRGRGS